jgi:hypothetical protein
MVTSARMPTAICAALTPDTPPPRIATLAGATPGHAAEQHAAAALLLLEIVGADLDRHAAATSDIGLSSGSDPSRAVTVS